MAATYHLLCVDCRRYLSVGKVYHILPDGSHQPTTFDGVFERATRRWHRRDEFFGAVIEAMLIQHRNHELRFVPEGVDELLETDLEAVDPIDPTELMRGHGYVDVDSTLELAEWSRRRSSE